MIGLQLIPISTFSRPLPIPSGTAVILPPPESSCSALTTACHRRHKAAQMWIQVPCAGRPEPLLGEMRLMARCGIGDIAIWSYLATAYMSSHTCADASRVWEVLTQTMQELR